MTCGSGARSYAHGYRTTAVDGTQQALVRNQFELLIQG